MEAKMNVKVAVYVPIVEATPVASKETLEYAIRHFKAESPLLDCLASSIWHVLHGTCYAANIT